MTEHPAAAPSPASPAATDGTYSKRRRWAIGAALVVLIGGLAWIGIQVRTATRILDAYLYALPLFELERVRYNAVYNPDNPNRHPPNLLVHNRILSDSTTRFITTPNNDTLYSLAVLDLSATAVRLETPDTHGRYYSAALIDAYTNNAAIIGRRTTGTQAQSYWIVGPRWKDSLPEGSKLIRSPTDTALLLVRVLVDGAEDLAEATVVQDRFSLVAVDGVPASAAAPPAPVEDNGASFIAVVNQGLQDNPPPADDAHELERIARVGLGSSAGPPPLAAWNRYLPLAHALLKQAIVHSGKPLNGWLYTPEGIGDFGTRYKLRAGIALAGLLALPPQEATYTSARSDNSGAQLDGSHRYRLHLPPGGVPVDAFWSLSIYEVENDGRLFFSDNPIHRYSIGDRTPELKRNADDSIDLYIQHDRPDESVASNWLPAPTGAFRLVARAYQPKKTLLNGSFRYPALERLPQ